MELSKIPNNLTSFTTLIKKLTFKQTQLFSYAIFSTQQNGEAHFKKHDFIKKFGLQNYKTDEAYGDTDKISSLNLRTSDLKNNKFGITKVCSYVEYSEGQFFFEWNPDVTPYILEIKANNILNDLEVTVNFRSFFSWRLYGYLKKYYKQQRKELTKEELFSLFGVSDSKSYQKTISNFKKRVLEVAIKEINDYTKMKVWYEEKKIGKKITGIIIYWSREKSSYRFTDKQLRTFKNIYNEVRYKTFDFITLENFSDFKEVRKLIIQIEEIHSKIYENLTPRQTEELIKKANQCRKELYACLENIKKKN